MIVLLAITVLAGVLSILAPCTLAVLPVVLGASGARSSRVRLTGVFIGFGATFVVSWIVRHVKRSEHLIEGTPTILIRHGQILTPNLVREGVTRDDLLRALREHGVDTVEEVRSAVLEVDGSVSVLKEDEVQPGIRPHHRIRGIPRRTP